MRIAVGMAEFKSIVIGIEAADKMIKAADVDVMMTKTVCPGKFVVMLSGNVADVRESINFAVDSMRDSLLDYFIIPNIHESILDAFKKSHKSTFYNAIGAMEFNRVASGVKALDVVLKAANVKLLKLNFGGGISGKCYFIVDGLVSDVEEALLAAEQKTDINRLMHKIVIPNPTAELLENLF
jgi:microcompartment protein CcmL/EutN